jgi:phenylalanine-4-hydroxylase
VKKQLERQYSQEEHNTWHILFDGLTYCRAYQAHPLFNLGVTKLGLTSSEISSLADVNQRLQALTGWQGAAVEGLEDPISFFAALANREFPVGNFIRDAMDVSYTPAPDVFHDLYGHLPFLADPDYANFCQDFGQRAMRFAEDPVLIKQFETLFWFGVEFPLIKTSAGLRIFGGGILSSAAESDYCLSSQPKRQPFNVEAIRFRPYAIDQMQDCLFVLEEPEQLYNSLDELEGLIERSRNQPFPSYSQTRVSSGV